MQTLIIGFGEDMVDGYLTSAGIRLGYLLSSELRLAGNQHRVHQIIDNLRALNYSDKIRILIESDKNMTAGQIEAYKKMQKIYKDIKSSRNVPKNVFVAFKRSEKAINEHFEAILEQKLKPLREAGMLNLQSLDDKPQYQFYNIDFNSPEREDSQFCRLSDVLQMQLADEDIDLPTVLFLNHPFFMPDAEHIHHIQVPPDSKFTDHGFIAPLMDLPWINLISIADMDILRIELHGALQKFNNAFDHFISLKSKPSAAFEYMQKEVTTAAGNLFSDLDHNQLYQNFCSNLLTGKRHLQLYAGMLPWKTIYEYYKYIKLIQGKTLDVINSVTPEAEWMPVVILKLMEENAYPETSDKPEEVVHTLKKAIEL